MAFSCCRRFAVAWRARTTDNAAVAHGGGLFWRKRGAGLQGFGKIMLLAAQTSVGEVLFASVWTWIGLVVAILCLVWIVVRVRAWFREDEDRAEDALRLLSEIQEMYEEGDLSEEEFRSIKGRLTKQRDRASSEGEQQQKPRFSKGPGF